MKRKLIVYGLVSLFILLIMLPACSALQEANPDISTSLASPVDSGKPGSGSWQPLKPNNEQQCSALYDVETQLVSKTNELQKLHTFTVKTCYDAKGNKLEDTDENACKQPIKKLEGVLISHVRDVIAGFQVYKPACEANGAPGVKLPTHIVDFLAADGDDPEKEPKEVTPVPTTDTDPGDTEEPWYGCPPYCCLTCTLEIEPVFYAQLLGAEPQE